MTKQHKLIRLAAVQFQSRIRVESDNLKRVEKFFSEAKNHKVDIICFPEYFLTAPMGYYHDDPDYINYLTTGFVKKAKRHFSQLCKKYRMHALMGTVAVKIGNNTFNRGYFFDENGKILGFGDKMNPVPNVEDKYITRGKKYRVFETKFGKMGVQVCRDILFPQVTIKLAQKGAKIIFCPSFWARYSNFDNPNLHRIELLKQSLKKTIHYLAPARAIDNDIYFIFINAAGLVKDAPFFEDLLGHSRICGPFIGKYKWINNAEETVIYYTVHLKYLEI